jgi:hypothetical protein
MALRAVTVARPARAPLSESEKAMLFDLAMDAGALTTARMPSRADALSAAPLIVAFAQAYVAIRDREDGVI